MVGINWLDATQAKFDKIVEILLRREFGMRGYAVNGRGGDDGIDYCVDDGRRVFQFKFFPDGFSTRQTTRRTQIKKSFKTAIKGNVLEEWTLVVPATLTPSERLFVTGLGKGMKDLKISIRDDTWLADVLMTAENKDLLENYLHASDIEFLHARAEAFRNNPVVRHTGDVAERIRQLKEAVDMVDPNYTLEFSTIGGQVFQQLVAKDPHAWQASPVTISFTADLTVDSPELSTLDHAADFGLAEDLFLSRDVIKDLKITGTSLLDASDPGAGIVLPATGGSQWQRTEVILKSGTGARVGIYLGRSRIRSSGAAGSVIELDLYGIVNLVFELRRATESVKVDLNVQLNENASTSDIFESADFLVKSQGSQLEVRAFDRRLVMAGEISDPPPGLIEEATEIRVLADDLRVVEAKTLTKFRFPPLISVRDRVAVRNLRLMFEGHCVAQPDATVMNFTLNGTRDDSLDQLLTLDERWLLVTTPPTTMDLLGEEIVLPPVSRAALVRLSQTELDAATAAFDSGEASGHIVTFRVRDGDRIRLFMPDERDPSLTVDITPWELTHVEQEGLTRDQLKAQQSQAVD